MTEYTFTMTIQTDGEIPDIEMEDWIAQFVHDLSQAESVLSAELSMSKDENDSLTEDERERLVQTIQQLDAEKQQAAIRIAQELSANSDEE